MAERAEFWVRFWGVRGSIACPGPATVRYGGNTSCVEVRCGEHRLIFDAGTGLRVLGGAFGNDHGLEAHVFLSHTHIDHVAGFPFFRPAYSQKNRFQFWAGHLGGRTGALQAVLADLMKAPIFPVPMDIMHACIAFHDFSAGQVLEPAPGLVIRTAPLNHPNGATGYRVEYDGRSVCYVTDTEHRESGLDQAIVALIRGAEIVIYDAMYTDREYQRFKGWGHSTFHEGVKLCEAAGAGRLVAFHHDPEHDDQMLDRIAAALEEARPGSLVAHEGLTLEP